MLPQTFVTLRHGAVPDGGFLFGLLTVLLFAKRRPFRSAY